MPTLASQDALQHALSTVIDPELRRPITELGMLESVSINDDGVATAVIRLTIAGCPLRDTIERDATAALLKVPSVTDVQVELTVMTPEQRTELKASLKGGGKRGNPFNAADSLARIYAVASGKGGVGKSTVTVNLACA
nr:Mrp/NBP35 family ATP-binding protein [Acidobacteriota bacterium]